MLWHESLIDVENDESADTGDLLEISDSFRCDLESVLKRFVALHGGMAQRGDAWYASMKSTVGGSELAALMGMSPYKGYYDVVAEKVAAMRGAPSWGGSTPTRWGTFFEDVIKGVVEADLGTTVVGDDICIRAAPGHRLSPDGFAVVRIYRRGDATAIWTTAPADAALAPYAVPRIALLEFKCPWSRAPTLEVPRHYLPQVLAGLAVSPVAHFGVYVDAVFRKCAYADLGPTAAYDVAGHSTAAAPDTPPFAWGLAALYAPAFIESADLLYPSDGGDGDVAAFYATATGTTWAADSPPIDLGDVDDAVFGRALALADRGRLTAAHYPPQFADGRPAGRDPPAIDALRGGPGVPGVPGVPDAWLVAVLPWKLFDISFVPVARRPGFFAEVAPVVADVHRDAAAAIASGDPAAYLRGRAAADPRGRRAGRATPRHAVSDTDVQALFDHA